MHELKSLVMMQLKDKIDIDDELKEILGDE